MNIPLSFRFEPTDEELLRGFLIPKVMEFKLPWNGIIDRDLYGNGAEPWNVFSGIDNAYWNTKKEGGATKETIYVFTKVTKVATVTKKEASSSKRNSRIAGCGTWSGQTGPKDIMRSDTGEIIGCTRMSSFQCSGAYKDLGHWIMHEYSLTDATGKTFTDLVVCKITKITKCNKKASEIPATTQFYAPATTRKRGGEELEQEGCKKQKCSGEGFVEAEDWNDVDLDNLIFDLDSI